jgi:hypothetical protein
MTFTVEWVECMAADPVKAFGAVLAKAMRSVLAGRGLVPILIALQ